jgi:hypothetical protein
MDPFASGLELALAAFQSKASQRRQMDMSTAYGEAELATATLSDFQKVKEVSDFVKNSPTITLRDFLLSEDFCAPYLRISANGGPLLSNVALAIVDAIDGTPIITLDDAAHQRIFGCPLGTLTLHRARKYLLSAGGRSGKTSRFLACVAVYCAWTTPLPNLAPKEGAFAFFSAPTKEIAVRIIRFIEGVFTTSPVLSKFGFASTESAKLIRPDGKKVIFRVSAKGKLSGRGGTCIFYGVDESEFFLDSASFDLDEQIKGAEQRVVPGGMVGIVSTPFIEGEGEMQRTLQRERGKHKGALCIERVSTRELNTTWDPTGEVEADMLAKPGGDANVQREIYAIPFPKGTKRFFNATKLRESMLRLSRKDLKPQGVGAGSDLGFRQDGCALVIAKRYSDMMIGIPLMKIEHPTDGYLVPNIVCADFAEIARTHGAAAVAADGVYAETYRFHLASVGLGLLDAPSGREGKVGMFTAARQVFHDDRVCLGDMDEDEREDLVDQLSRITTKKLPGGGEEIIVPRRVVRNEADAGQATTDHCDGAAAFVLALWACGAGAGVNIAQGAPVSVPQTAAPPRTDGAPKVRGVSFGAVQKRPWR